MFDESLHRRIVAVPFCAKLDREAFAQVAGTDAGRIEFLQHRGHGVDISLRCAEPLCCLAEIRWQIAAVVDQVDQILADRALQRST